MKIPVLIPNIFNYAFTYDTNKLKLSAGDYVIVPFGKSNKIGVVWSEFEKNSSKNFSIKKVIKKLEVPKLNIETINFINKFSSYNLIPKGMALKLLIGSNISEKLKYDKLVNKVSFKKYKFELSEEQKSSLKEMNKNNEKFRVHVLQGITGSGKTIVYFEALKEILKKGLQVLVLLPEIGLTSQFEKKFEEFFGFKPLLWHSRISKKNKQLMWKDIVSGSSKVVIGARSSLFLPFKKLGMIIVDEEHDQSYKQDEGVIYNARDMAILRGFEENIPVNLITAVPSIETFDNIKKNKYSLSKLTKRYKDASLPNYQIIDLNKSNKKKSKWISDEIIKKVDEHLNKKDQVLFFLNRRGFSPSAFCTKCLKVSFCPNCSIKLVYHKNKNNLLCHYCGYKTQLNRKCEKGDKCIFTFSGPGVERIAEEIKKLFPLKKQAIFSSDTMNKKKSFEIIDKITKNEIEILVATQLASKGFHFPHLNCIVVVDIDLTTQGHDLRAAEKNLQLYHQLAGRAGRTGKPATVYFQTYNINKNMILDITNKDPDIFLNKELELRRMNKLPPFERFISLIITGSNEKILENNCLNFKKHLDDKIKCKILGPVNAPLYKLKKKFRSRLLIRSDKKTSIQESLSKIIPKFKFSKGIKLIVDVDPINFN
tara:strand:- start:3476 stop:5428 length:1953 start_codon:yes stop_codon:yes gene_type:complete